MRRLTSTTVIFFVLTVVAVLAAACSMPSVPAPVTPSLAPVIATTTAPTSAPQLTRTPAPAQIVVTATPQPDSACASTAGGIVDHYAVGLLAPLSQAQVWPRAIALQAGASIALEELNGAGGLLGRPLRLISLDTQGDPNLAATLAEQLIVEECVFGLIGGIGAETASIRAVSERHGVPFLVAETPDDSLTADQPATLFRIGPAATQAEEMTPRWLTEVGDYNGDGSVMAVLVAENSAAGDMAVEQAARQMPAYDLALETLRADLPMEDFSPVIARIVAMEQAPDAILIHVAGDPGLLLLQQLLEAGIGPAKGTLLVTGRAALDSARFWQLAPSGELTVVQRRGPWYASLNEIGLAFLDKYRLLSNQWPEWPAFAGYDSLYLLAAAATQATTTQSDALLTALEMIDVTLASGHYAFPFGQTNPPDGDAEPAFWWHQWLDPQLLMLQYQTAQQDASTLDVVWPPVYRTTDGPVLP